MKPRALVRRSRAEWWTPARRAAESRLRLRIERAIERLGVRAVRSGLDPLGAVLAWPLRVSAELRHAPFIVVLSGGISSKAILNATTVARIREAAALFQRGLAPALIMSGGLRRPGRPSSAPRMQALAAELGVPRDRILLEERSSRTAENAHEVAHLLRRHGASSAILVTGALHMRRAKLCFERQGITVLPAPVATHPEEPAERRSLVSQLLHEYVGLAYYRALGWI